MPICWFVHLIQFFVLKSSIFWTSFDDSCSCKNKTNFNCVSTSVRISVDRLAHTCKLVRRFGYVSLARLYECSVYTTLTSFVRIKHLTLLHFASTVSRSHWFHTHTNTLACMDTHSIAHAHIKLPPRIDCIIHSSFL